MIYITNYYTWAAVEYYLLHYVLKQYDIQKRRKKDQISNKELDYLEIYKWDNMIKNNIFLYHSATLDLSQYLYHECSSQSFVPVYFVIFVVYINIFVQQSPRQWYNNQ